MNTERRVKAEHPNGTVETRDYDKAEQLIFILDKCVGTQKSTVRNTAMMRRITELQ